MQQTFVYFQPEYVNKFKCNGQACQALCCKNWYIDIDKETYKKFSKIKPKNKFEEIVQNIKWSEIYNSYLIQLNPPKNFCPFLTEDNLCKIQREYGADYLSNTCMTYPRVTFRIGNFYERTLTLSCPVAADIILNCKEPMIFEQVEVSAKEYMETCRDMVRIVKVSPELSKYIIDIQYAVISTLQERRLTIDQRLIVTGYFFSQLEEIINNNKLEEIVLLAQIYTSEDFIREQVPKLVKSIEFNVKEYIRIMFDIFAMLYGNNNDLKNAAQNYLNYIVKFLDIKIDKYGTASISELVQSYNKHSKAKENFLQEYGYIFENYLVQEFFTCLYPWSIEGTISLNYEVFMVTYKILELLSLSMAVVQKDKIDNRELIKLIRWFVQNLNHGKDYVESISKGFKDKTDIIKMMHSFLQG